jgi:hypothetical protein
MMTVRIPGRWFAAATILALCVSPAVASAQHGDEAHPAVGVWAHSVDTDQGPFKGDLTIAVEADALSGTITFVDFGSSEPLDEVAFEDGALTFSFATEFGTADVKVTLDGDAFSGSLDLPGADAYGLYMTGERKAAGGQ